ncbi:probable E3 ubiquitin-protein ligase DTX3 isoform X2 [Polypterus senegalus]|uniref:probable E3 ubiquitin-protein ligase DTX3 isoform X2 n=1 Tax=Polypterus senegalus TaxID=55291 RepID=UPI001962C582|nr:probable E3 ubiquitin-protein ligase DTX3 isoform X2 [Polypterus senegalus]
MGSQVSSSAMSVRMGKVSDELLLSQPLWEYLMAEPRRMAEFQKKHGVCAERLQDTQGRCTIRLQLAEGTGAVTTAMRKAFMSLCRAAHKDMTKETEPGRKRSLRQALQCVAGNVADEPCSRKSQRQRLQSANMEAPEAGKQGDPGVAVEADFRATGSPANYEADGEDPSCSICMGEMVERETLDKCGHSFCKECLKQAFQVKRACPVCRLVYGKLIGNQPVNGTMMVERYPDLELPGYEGHGCICIVYSFPPGIQGPEHVNPGVCYPGTNRVAYLPDNREGNRILHMLRKAFDQRLIFTIGTSMTTGLSNVITWNDIHHKTSIWGGPRRFGYPDPTYLVRVSQELQEKGITPD